ncbi:SWIM zinc finger family protein [Psychrobacter sp. I-STPA10]|uniref:SWIM zinc finger family protein n=1 Tax=Psychrobacter sp. I-STPA10 TaxID=2585769 RepID=UPI001E4B95E6|nr:SWIM zinc finger family protein [Psychrobacter sp. I-STPA10]
MTITLETVQNIAPDQASLNAAKKLLKPAKWPVKQQIDSKELAWGHCQGSGANPYYTVIDTSNHGYKCTCPSRKFPCKHVLALMWQYADDDSSFAVAEVPQWVTDWLGRRRNKSTSVGTTTEDASNTDKDTTTKKITASIAKTGMDNQVSTAAKIDPEAEAKKQAAAAKRAAKLKAATDKAISAGLKEYEQWLADQLRTGLINFLDHATERCRNISARLVDAKATNLAARLDELPAKLMQIPKENQLRMATNELGKIVCLVKAWQANCDDKDVRRAISSAESRDSVLENADTISQQGIWQVVAEQVENRRDGLISHATWLRYLGGVGDLDNLASLGDTLSAEALQSLSQERSQLTQAANAQSQPMPVVPFALLQDYYPASTGRRSTSASLGGYLIADIRYYPSRYPLRAVIASQQHVDEQLASVISALTGTGMNVNNGQNPFKFYPCQQDSHLPQSVFEFYRGYQQALAVMPWLEAMPCLLPCGHIRPMLSPSLNQSTSKGQKNQQNRLWWQADDGLQNNVIKPHENSKQAQQQSLQSAQWQLPLRPNQSQNQRSLDYVLACPLTHSFILWDGVYATFGSGYHQHWGQLSW